MHLTVNAYREVKGGATGILWRRLAATLLVPALSLVAVAAGAVTPALPEFAYQKVTLNVVQADGSPVAGATIYGFCTNLNLVWPRAMTDAQWSETNIWHRSYFGKTDKNGKIEATIPPGKWAFMATAHLPGNTPKALVVWTNYLEPKPGESIRLAPAIVKNWSFCAPNGQVLEPKQLFFKPQGLPIWMPVGAEPSDQPWQVELSAGNVNVWGEADAIGAMPGFALSWGMLSNLIPDGKIRLPGNTVQVDFKGGDGRAQLRWSSLHNYALDGQINLAKNAKVVISPGDFTLGYRRTVAEKYTGTFVGGFFPLKANDQLAFDLDAPLTAVLDQSLPATPTPQEEVEEAVTGEMKNALSAQLYLVDGSGHLLSELDDATGAPVKFSASVMVAGKKYSAEAGADKTALEDGGQTLFSANVATTMGVDQAVWNITGPPGVLPTNQFVPAKLVMVKSATFQVSVPEILAAQVRNILNEAEITAQTMAQASNRQRAVTPTTLHVVPGHHGASASHNGTSISIGTKIFFTEELVLRHDFVHELGHNFAFTHGGLHETNNEVTRSYAAEQISEQPAKWMFLDRMNGLKHKEVSYHNTGLYLYCYAQGGLPFLHYISLNEYAVIKGLKDFTADEVETAVLGLALNRDMTAICAAYGLKVTSERVAQATAAARPLCKMPRS